jgi:uncharacterized protein (DUF58 family)
MIYKDALKKIRKIQIITSRMANALSTGQYRSAFKGRGLEFGEIREYHAGDDIRFIDWNVTARTGHLHVKKFIEERELTILFLMDLSPSSRFGTVHSLKNQLAAELCALLAFTALKNNDKIGMLLFTDRVEKFIPPQKGSRQALRIIRDALYFKPEGTGTNISAALEYLNSITKRRTVTFIFSDFYSHPFKKLLAVTAKRHDIIAVALNDPLEVNLPNVGLLALNDAETGETSIIDTGDTRLREAYRVHNLQRLNERKRLFSSINIDFIDIRTDVPYLPTLINFFRVRERRFRH